MRHASNKKNRNQHLTDGMKRRTQDKIKMFEERETYKYLGILETVTFKEKEIKEKKIKKEYFKNSESYSRQNYIAENVSTV